MTLPRPAVTPDLLSPQAAGQPAPDAAAVIDDVDVDAVAAAVRACPAVADLFAGRLGEVGSYLPGRRVPGVVVDGQTLTVHIRSRWDIPASEVLRQVGDAVRGLQHGHQLQVVVADIDDLTGADPVIANPDPNTAPRHTPTARQTPTARPAPSNALLSPPRESEY